MRAWPEKPGVRRPRLGFQRRGAPAVPGAASGAAGAAGAGSAEGGAPGTAAANAAALGLCSGWARRTPQRPPSRADAPRGSAAALRAPPLIMPGARARQPEQPGHHAGGRRWRLRGGARTHSGQRAAAGGGTGGVWWGPSQGWREVKGTSGGANPRGGLRRKVPEPLQQ